MGVQIVYTSEDIDVHKEEIIGYVKQFVPLALTVEIPAQQGCQVEQQLEAKDDGVDGAGIEGCQGDVQGNECHHGNGCDAPAQHAVGEELEGYGKVPEGVQHVAQPPYAL